MSKTKKQMSNGTVKAKSTIFKKGSDKKKLKKLKRVVETTKINSNSTIIQKSVKKDSEIKKLKKLKGLVETTKIKSNSTISQKSVKKQKSEKDKTKKIKSKEYINPEICQKFTITTNDVLNVIKGIVKYRAENPKLQKVLFQEGAPFFLQISCHKIPKGNPKILRIPLKHSLYSSDSEICLIVSEVKGIPNREHEKHIEHYEKLLGEKKVENVKKIMTFHEFRTEYETFEQKQRLVDVYDVFLADSKIAGKLVKKCGKIFYKKRKIPTAIKLPASKLKEHVDKALRKTFFNLHLKGNNYSVQFGHTNMSDKQLVQNFSSVLEYLDKEFPGGSENIQGVLISAPRAPSISAYISTKSANDLVVPKVVDKTPKAYKIHKGELTTLPNAKVTVKPSGEVIVERKKKKQ